MPPARFTRALHRWPRLPRWARRDRGAMSLLMLVTVVGLFAIAGLVIDGGGKLQALSHAEGLAQEAARAGGQAIDTGKAISGDGIEVDRNAAVAAARSYLHDAGVTGTVDVSDDGGSLQVTVQEHYDPVFLAVGTWTVTGHGSASLIYRG